MDVSVKPLLGKRILFFCPSFFDYEKHISHKLENLGASVDYYDSRSITRMINKAILKILPFVFYFTTIKYYNHILEEHKDDNYDYIFFIKCDMTPLIVLKKLKKHYKEAKFVLYLWGSIRNQKSIIKKFKFFDFISSFDRSDSKKYHFIHFRPLFFTDIFNANSCEVVLTKNIDLFFYGTIHSNRFDVIKLINEYCAKNRLNFHFLGYIHSKMLFLFYKLTKRSFANSKFHMFTYVKSTLYDIKKISNMSKAVIDIQHPKQSGLTMRTFEILSMGVKLVTTNTDIKNYDFFSPENILIIDPNNPVIPHSFLEKPFSKIENSVLSRYSLETWIKETLDLL